MMHEKFLKDIRERYFLAKHIFYTNVDGHFVVLDLRQNSYLLLSDTEKYVFSVLFEGQNKLDAQGPDHFKKLIEDLVIQGLLVDTPQKARQHSAPDLPPVTREISGYPYDGLPAIRASHVYRCLKAFLYTRLVWWFNPMEKIIHKIKKRQTRLAAHPQPEASIEQIRELIEIFRILKGLFYTAHNECLFDSLTMVNFLASYGIYPHVVFGVQMGPFAAHAWVQEGRRIYNGQITQVADFKPIMIV
ncbi:lasso peptide biosynthesis B2 protein [Paremcibacter congregatus]|uniref:lasso peptide biosynthesis B2 protein n=1 Tax=Paremcibacter congregatus TaxID=2043170 RepID=UPI003A946139